MKTTNSPVHTRRAVREAKDGGRITRGEAQQLLRELRRDGLTDPEYFSIQKLLRQDFFQDPGAARTLRRGLDALRINNPARVGNAAQVAASDGKITVKEAKNVLRQASLGGFLDGERAQLERLRERYADSFSAEAGRVFDRFLEQTKTPPARTEPKTVTIHGVKVHTNGVSQKAIDQLERILPRLLQRRDIRERLKDLNFTISIVPFDKRLTDDGVRGNVVLGSVKGDRPQDFRGYGGRFGDRAAVFIGEEDLANLPTKIGRKQYSLGAHEIAHAVLVGLSPKEREAVARAFEHRKAEGSGFTSQYAKTDSGEYFAEATSAFLGRGPNGERNGRAWLKRNDPELYRILARIY